MFLVLLLLPLLTHSPSPSIRLLLPTTLLLLPSLPLRTSAPTHVSPSPRPSTSPSPTSWPAKLRIRLSSLLKFLAVRSTKLQVLT
jgi:hypothetical protein